VIGQLGLPRSSDRCEHAFVGPKGSLRGNFQRAIDRRQLFNAEIAARQLAPLSIADALALALLIADEDPARFDRAGPRWHARFVLETGRIGLLEAQLALAAVAALPARDAKAGNVLRELARRYRVPNIDAALWR
jgi:hypothetical protein